MILDYKLFTPYAPLQNDTLWVLEQIPGYVEAADVTQVLRDTGYFASYNLPYFKDIYNMSGVTALYDQYGDFFSYDQCPRAQIFRRNHTNVREY